MTLIRKCMKGLAITVSCLAGLIAPLTLPIFAVVAISTRQASYLLCPFIIVELKSIITFIVES